MILLHTWNGSDKDTTEIGYDEVYWEYMLIKYVNDNIVQNHT